MVRKTLMAASLALLAVGLGRPSAAAPVFLEPYGDIFAARPLLASPADPRAKDAVQAQESRRETPTKRIFAHGFARGSDDFFLGGGGLAFADASNPQNPWQIQANFFGIDPDGPGDSEFGFDVNGKVVVWMPDREWLPVVSVVGRYMRINNVADSVTVLVAADQQIARNVYITGNVGFGWVDFDGAVGGLDDQEGLVAGLGATWRALPRLSISGNYVFDTDQEVFYGNARGEDFWTVSALYALNETFSFRIGGGKDTTIFGNLIAKWD